MPDKKLAEAMNLRQVGKLEESNRQFVDLIKHREPNAVLFYQAASSFDLLGRESEAIPYYEKAIRLGLEEKDLKEAYLGLGSSCRALGEYAKAQKVFEKALSVFEADNALKVFYAMTLFNLKQHEQAMELLLKVVAETSADENVHQYAKAITFYSDKLDQMWR